MSVSLQLQSTRSNAELEIADLYFHALVTHFSMLTLKRASIKIDRNNGVALLEVKQ